MNIAGENNRKEMFEILISKGTDINLTFLIYQNMEILFLIKII